MIPINYHHLYYYWTVAKCGSIAAAKDRLYLSQPTLSAQLRELERFCKADLLIRGRKGVSLTPEGQVVFAYCERIFGAGDELVALLNKGFAGGSVLRVGVEPTISRDVVIHMLNFAQRRDKSVRLAIFSGEPESLGGRLRRGDLDLVVSHDDLSSHLGRDYRGRLVCSVPVCFVSTPAIKRMVRRFPRDLSRVPVLLRPPEHPVRKQVEAYLSRHKIDVAVEAGLDDVDLIQRLAIEGRGAAAMDTLSALPALKAKRLVKLHQGALGIRERIWFVSSRHPKPSLPLKAMLDAFLDAFRIAV